MSESSIVEWFQRHKNKIGLVVVGHTAKRVEEYIFDWLIYGYVVYFATETWGPWYGSVAAFTIMAPVSALFCWFYFLAYDWAKKDIFGFEALKELKAEQASDGWFARQLRRVLKWGDVPAFFALSIYHDPFMVIVYLRRKGHGHRSFTVRDWNIFWMAVLFSNAYWTLRWVIIFELARVAWNSIIKPFLLSAGLI